MRCESCHHTVPNLLFCVASNSSLFFFLFHFHGFIMWRRDFFFFFSVGDTDTWEKGVITNQSSLFRSRDHGYQPIRDQHFLLFSRWHWYLREEEGGLDWGKKEDARKLEGERWQVIIIYSYFKTIHDFGYRLKIQVKGLGRKTQLRHPGFLAIYYWWF